MGQYIQAGICYNIKVSKTRMKGSNISYEKLLDGLKKEIPIDLYEVNETEDGYFFTLKDEILEKGQLPEFLTEQYKLFNAEKDKAMEIITELKDLNKSTDIIEFAEQKRYENFQYSNINKNIYCGIWGEGLLVEYELILFFMAGKVIMECYNEFLVYIENLIKKENIYKISQAVKVLIA